MNKLAQLYHAPLTCSFAVRLAASWGNVELDILPVRLGKNETESETAHQASNPLGQVSTLILPDQTILTETSACLIWVQSQSSLPNFKRTPDSSEFYQVLRWIGFCATELHKQLLRIVFYEEATEDVKDKFRKLSVLRLKLLNSHLEHRDTLVGETLSAADAYLVWFCTLSDRAGVALAPYTHIASYFEKHQSDERFRRLSEDDKKLKEILSHKS